MPTLRTPVDVPDQPTGPIAAGHEITASGPGLVPAGARYAVVALGVTLIWLGTIWVSIHLHTDPVLHRVALFVHLACLVIGFGGVLTLDWYGILWLLGRRSLRQVVDAAAATHLLIWIGLGGLMLTGILLAPELHRLTCIKLAAVLVIALNGINAHQFHGTLGAATGTLDRGLLTRVAATGVLSQAGWWTACVIGFINRG